jgi:serine protease Do
MKKIACLFVLLLTFGLSNIACAKVLPQIFTQNNPSISPMLENITPAVVNIVTRGEIRIFNDPFLKRELKKYKAFRMLDNKRFVSFGSGVVIDAKHGLIVTNAHLVSMEKAITVTLKDGRHYEAKKIGADNETDIAVIKIKAKNLTEINFADSNEIKVGDFVVAIGSPFGLKQSVTSGIVSALNRSNLGIEHLENFIQTDAPINIGNSGGALVNMQGQLIGINTALISSTGGNVGVGFAIPSNMVKSIVEQLLKFGKVHRGLMGVLVQTLNPDLAEAFNLKGVKGSIVSRVVPFSPAATAGIKVGDVIVSVNGHTIKSGDDMHNFVGLLRMGATAKLNILRNGKKINISVVTANPQLSEKKSHEANPYLYGIQMENVTEQNPYHGYVTGIRILRVDEYCPAWTVGLRPGDLVISVNHKRIATIKELETIASAEKNGLLLNVLRGPGAAFIVIK